MGVLIYSGCPAMTSLFGVRRADPVDYELVEVHHESLAGFVDVGSR